MVWNEIDVLAARLNLHSFFGGAFTLFPVVTTKENVRILSRVQQSISHDTRFARALHTGGASTAVSEIHIVRNCMALKFSQMVKCVLADYDHVTIAPVRRSFHAAFEVAKKLEKQGNCVGAKRMQVIGLGLQTKLKEFATAVRWLVALDRHQFVERKAYDAQIAHDNNDARGCFAVVRALHGGKPRAHKTILKKCGEKTQNEGQRKERWQEHWAEVFQGTIVGFSSSSI